MPVAGRAVISYTYYVRIQFNGLIILLYNIFYIFLFPSISIDDMGATSGGFLLDLSFS